MPSPVVSLTLRLEMFSPNRSVSAATPTAKHHNRVLAIMIHLPRYWSRGAAQLARDIGVSKSTISRLVRGKSHPLYRTACKIVKCLQQELGRPLTHDEVFSDSGLYPTQFVCDLVNCPGCSDDRFFDLDSCRRAGCQHLERGRWTGDAFELEELTEQKGEI